MSCSAIHTALPDSDILLALEPEELGHVVLELLKVQVGNPVVRSNNVLQRGAFVHLDKVQGYPREDRQAILEALNESWNWLQCVGLIARGGDAHHELFFITRRGYQLKTVLNFETFRKARLLPKELLHRQIAESVWLVFVRGQYDTAVFQAFKQVEVSVRTAGRFEPTDIGVPLMRKAFDPQQGPLTDMDTPAAEREALAHLVTGAIGSYKNPNSHRHVTIGAEEAIEIVMLASHILKIVEARSSRSTPSVP